MGMWGQLTPVDVLYMSSYPREVIAKDNLIPSDTNLMHKPFDTRSLLRGVRGALDETTIGNIIT